MYSRVVQTQLKPEIPSPRTKTLDAGKTELVLRAMRRAAQAKDAAALSFGTWITGYPRSRILRMIHRTPVLLWRLGLGPLLGRVFILITTRGRRSGCPRRAVLARHVMGGRVYGLCPYGSRAQWYRNVTVDPQVAVQTYHGPRFARAVRVTDDDELMKLYEFLEQSDRGSLEYMLDQAGIAHDRFEMAAHKKDVYVVRFDPGALSELPVVRADLAWAWLLALIAWLAVLRGRSQRQGFFSALPLRRD